MKYIDFHTHIFPDNIAGYAVNKLAGHSKNYKPQTNGTLKNLIESMDKAQIKLSLTANIATKPSQLKNIFDFCLKIKSDRVYPLLSFHPLNSEEEVKELIKNAGYNGIKGIKLHPMYQDFYIDGENMFPFYEMIQKKDMFIQFHSGYDIAFSDDSRADIERIRAIALKFENLKIVTTHTGGWRQWEKVPEVLAPLENVYYEISMTQTEMEDADFVKLIKILDENKIFFGTDSPWTNQTKMIERFITLPLELEIKNKILYANAEKFLKNA